MREGSRLTRAERAPFAEFARDVRGSLLLRPRQLPARYFYDDLGSALFEAICRLPWYRVTRAELSLLDRHGREVWTEAGPVARLVELGPGSGEKLERLLDHGGPAVSRLEVHLVDVSASALEVASRRIAARPQVRVAMHESAYEEGLRAALVNPVGLGRALVLFLGSNIGNFDPQAARGLLRSVRAVLNSRDSFLLGADLTKSESALVAAYDDPLGVTASFNKNILCRINRELGGNFDLSRFTHRALWNADASRVEMHLVSRGDQRVRIAAADLEFILDDGETIWTESSYKYGRADVVRCLETAGFSVTKQWVDEEAGFALTLARAS